MPIKFEFANKSGRANFEKMMRECCGVRAVQSYPEPIRREMAVFRKALQDRYQDEIVMVKPDVNTLSFVAYKKSDGAPRWEDCVEPHAIPLGIMLPGYTSPNMIRLPEAVSRETSNGGATTDTESECM